MVRRSETDIELLALRKQVDDLRAAAVVRRRVEQALREAEARHRAFLDQTPLALCRLDADGHVAVATLAFARALGFATRRSLYEAAATRTIFGSVAAWPELVACLADIPDLRLETPLTHALGDAVTARLRALRDADGTHVTLVLEPVG